MPSEQTMFNTPEDNSPQQDNHSGQSNNNKSYFGELVGDGKKFSDAEALAKSKLEADRHISNLESQLKEIREELAKRESAEEIAERLRNERNADPKPSTSTPGLSEERVAEIVKNTVTSIERSRSVRENVLEAERQFKSMYGDKTQEVLKAKASELGMTVEQLGKIAGESPTAFGKLVGLEKKDSKASGNQSPMDSDLNQEGFHNNNQHGPLKEGSQAYWAAKRKELGAKFWEPKIQQQIMKDKMEGRYDA